LLVLCPHFSLPTDIHSLSLHDALPISRRRPRPRRLHRRRRGGAPLLRPHPRPGPAPPPAAAAPDSRTRLRPPPRRPAPRPALGRDRKSTRLNSSHVKISYAVFCLKKKK